MSALFCLFLCFRSYPELLEVYIPTFYKIRYILEELYVADICFIGQLIIYIDQLNTTLVTLVKVLRLRMYSEIQIEIMTNPKLLYRFAKCARSYCSICISKLSGKSQASQTSKEQLKKHWLYAIEYLNCLPNIIFEKQDSTWKLLAPLS